MSGFSSIATPGGIPTFSVGGKPLDMQESLFRSQAEKSAYRRMMDGFSGSGGELLIDKVRVRVFDLSDKDQVSEYETLWADLLEKAARGEVVIDHHKDLVRRADGTSYWMKYVEYVEFKGADHKTRSHDDGAKKESDK